MEKLNLFGYIKTNLFPNTITPPKLYNSNIGDCGNVMNSSNNLTDLYNVNNLVNTNRFSFYFLNSNGGYYTARLVNLSSASVQNFFRDCYIITNSANTNTLRGFKSNVVNNLFVGYGKTYNILGSSTSRLSPTNLNFNQELVLWANSTISLPLLTAGGMTQQLNSQSPAGISTNTFNASTGQFSILPAGAYSRKFILKMATYITATFNSSSYFLINLYLNNVIIHTQRVDLTADMTSVKFFICKLIQFDAQTTTNTPLWAGITYIGGSNFVPIISGSNQNIQNMVKLKEI